MLCSVMHHAGSLYHEHMASEKGVPSRYNTHEYCMRIEYENYGCENCIWYKWWGEKHGFPDINPWSFREHLVTNNAGLIKGAHVRAVCLLDIQPFLQIVVSRA